MTDAKSVLLVDTLSGSNDFAVELVRALKDHVRLTVFTVESTKLDAIDCARLVPLFPAYGGPDSKAVKLLKQVRATLSLARELLRHRHDVVHVQAFRFTGFELPVYVLLRGMVRRLVWTAHNALPHEPKWWHYHVYRLWYRLMDRVHVLSKHTLETMVASMQVPRQKLGLVPHGNYASFHRAYPPAAHSTLRQQWGAGPDQIVILFFGLVRAYKGVDRLLQAYSHLVERKDLLLVIAGGSEADMRAVMDGELDRLGLRGRVRMDLRFLSDRELADHLYAADIVAFPYRHIYQSGALLLAMTLGKAIVASDIPGFREYLSAGVDGELCNTSNSLVFAEKLETLADEPQRRRNLGLAASHSAQHRFAWSAIAAQLVALY